MKALLLSAIALVACTPSSETGGARNIEVAPVASATPLAIDPRSAPPSKPRPSPRQGSLERVFCSQEGQVRSSPSNDATTITFVNDSFGPLDVYWLDFDGARVLYQRLEPHGSYTQQTYVSHSWLVADDDGCRGIVVPTTAHGSRLAVSELP